MKQLEVNNINENEQLNKMCEEIRILDNTKQNIMETLSAARKLDEIETNISKCYNELETESWKNVGEYLFIINTTWKSMKDD